MSGARLRIEPARALELGDRLAVSPEALQAITEPRAGDRLLGRAELGPVLLEQALEDLDGARGRAVLEHHLARELQRVGALRESLEVGVDGGDGAVGLTGVRERVDVDEKRLGRVVGREPLKLRDDRVEALGRFDEAIFGPGDATHHAQAIEVGRVEVERELRHPGRALVVVQVPVAHERDLAGEARARVIALGARELVLEELDRGRVVGALEVLGEELLRRGRVLRVRVERALQAIDGARHVAGLVEQRRGAQVLVRLLGGRLRAIGERVDRVEGALRVAEPRLQARERGQRPRVAVGDREHRGQAVGRDLRLAEAFVEQAREREADLDAVRVVLTDVELSLVEIEQVLIALGAAVVASELIRRRRALRIELEHLLERRRRFHRVQELLVVDPGQALVEPDPLPTGDGDLELELEHLDELLVAPEAVQDTIEALQGVAVPRVLAERLAIELLGGLELVELELVDLGELEALLDLRLAGQRLHAPFQDLQRALGLTARPKQARHALRRASVAGIFGQHGVEELLGRGRITELVGEDLRGLALQLTRRGRRGDVGAVHQDLTELDPALSLTVELRERRQDRVVARIERERVAQHRER